MIRYVVDAGVVAKWSLEEEHSEAARMLRSERIVLFAPDFMLIELANVLWKRVRRGELAGDDAVSILQVTHATGISFAPTWPLVASASMIAHKTNRTVYDSMYLALAVELDCPFVTADRKLVNGLSGHAVADRIVWVADIDQPDKSGRTTPG